jgi:hypothetical protein
MPMVELKPTHRVPPPLPPQRGRAAAGTHSAVGVIAASAAVVILLTIVGVVMWLRGSADGRRAVVAAVGGGGPGDESHDPLGFGEAAQTEQAQRRKEQKARKERERAERDAEEKSRQERETQEAEAAENRKREAAEMERRKADQAKAAAERRRAEAFEALGKLPSVIPTDLPVPGGVAGGASKSCDLGPIDVDELLDLSFSLAVPRETLNASPFKAWVDSVGDGSGKSNSWIIRSAGDTSIEKNAKPIDLAILDVNDGRLELRPASAVVINNPRFRLLRRSVLLVKARDPAAKDDTPATVCCAMQLVRPKPAQAEIQVPLVTKSDDGPKPIPMKLEVPAGITVSPESNATPPAVPLEGTTVEYEVAFDHQPDGTKQPATYPRTQASGDFCPLLTCPAHPDVPPQPPTMVGVKVEVSLPQGVIKVTPTVDGPGEKQFDLANLGPVVLYSEEQYEKWKERVFLPLRKRVTPLVKARVDAFAAVAAESNALTDEYRVDIASYLSRMAPEHRPFDGRRTDSYEAWASECERILRHLEDLKQRSTRVSNAYAEGMQALQAKWEATYSNRLQQWFEDYRKRRFEREDLAREGLQPFRSPVRVVLKRVMTTAFASDGGEYSVVLVAGEPAGGRSDLDVELR